MALTTNAGPIYGTGIVPANGAIAAQLNAVTRRAFVPKLVVQIYKAAPLLSLLMRNAQRASGGLSPITIPIQGSSFVSFNWTGYSGGFQVPSDQAALTTAAWNLAMGVVPIGLMGSEALIQRTETVIPIIKARMADAKTVAVQAIAGQLFGSNANNTLAMNGLQDIYDDGTTVSSYGGVSRTQAPYWASVKNTTAITPSRTNMITQLVATTSQAGGEAPDIVLMSPSDWCTLLTDFMSIENVTVTKDSMFGMDDAVNSGFRALMLAGTPIMMDPFCPKGTCYIVNSRYLAMYLSEDANFAFSGFESLIPQGQIAQVGVVIAAMASVCSKPSTGRQLSNIQGGAF